MNYLHKKVYILALFTVYCSFSQAMDGQNTYLGIDTSHVEEKNGPLTGNEIVQLFWRLSDYFPVEIVNHIGNLMIGNCLDYHNMAKQSSSDTFRPQQIAYSPDNKTALFCGGTETAVLINSLTGEKQCKLEDGHTKRVNGGTFSPNGKYVLTYSEDCRACIWDTKTGKLCMVLGPKAGYDSRLIPKITYKWDTQKKVFNLETLHHSQELTSAAFSPDSSTALTCSKDKMAILWDVQSGKPLCQLDHSGALVGGKFSGDGKAIHTFLEDKTTCLWKTIPCEASQFISKHSRFLQAWFIVQASKTKRTDGFWKIQSDGVEHSIFATFPEVVQEYLRGHYSIIVK